MRDGGSPIVWLKQSIDAQGVSAINDLVAEKQEETLHLEFKTLSTDGASTLTKEDRRLIAKSICGFANAEGGILLIGIETVRSEGVDVANLTRPLGNVGAIRNRIVSAVPEMLSPQHAQISIQVVSEAADPARGYIVISVSPSQNRPHMSVPHHQYFRRGSDGTRVLEHGEIRELMFALREGKLSLHYRFQHSMSSGNKIFAFDLILSIRNEGKTAVRAPFVRVSRGVAHLVVEPDSAFTRRRLLNDNWGIYTNRDFLIHVGDGIDICAIRTGIHLHEADEYEAKYFIRKILLEARKPQFSIRPYSNSRNDPRPYDRLIDVEVAFGAENVATQVETIALDKWKTLEMMAEIVAPSV